MPACRYFRHGISSPSLQETPAQFTRKKIIRMKNKLLLFFTIALTLQLRAQGGWTQKTSFPGAMRDGSVSFAIGTKGYISTGILDTSNTLPPTVYNDLWEY